MQDTNIFLKTHTIKSSKKWTLLDKRENNAWTPSHIYFQYISLSKVLVIQKKRLGGLGWGIFGSAPLLDSSLFSYQHDRVVLACSLAGYFFGTADT